MDRVAGRVDFFSPLTRFYGRLHIEIVQAFIFFLIISHNFFAIEMGLVAYIEYK